MDTGTVVFFFFSTLTSRLLGCQPLRLVAHGCEESILSTGSLCAPQLLTDSEREKKKKRRPAKGCARQSVGFFFLSEVSVEIELLSLMEGDFNETY